MTMRRYAELHAAERGGKKLSIAQLDWLTAMEDMAGVQEEQNIDKIMALVGR